ncbi:hypothetical protein QAD02_018560 [Eretmocerus hayati]|uniref:Uncharacterized protein n=1 Tax=Eretmocerus hayati TaxID=131215 RepID=A0ACC2PI99_9HYME|nr:hypothetical protein QAD02_018560 [Eretmocerus hayati]
MDDKEEEVASPSTGDGEKSEEKTLENPTSSETTQENTQNVEPGSSDTIVNEVVPPKEKKVEILLKATGDAPIMTKKKWSVGEDKTIGSISEFIKKFIKMGPEERLFLYINQTFAPAPDQTVKNLFDCYGTDGKLIIHYCKSQAWG